MDEVDIGVGLEQVAPGALARMRLARDQQHAQLVAHALDGDDGAVVGERQLVVERGGLDLYDIGAAAVDADRQRDGLADRDLAAGDDLAVAPHGQGGAAGAALLEHAQPHRLVLADDAEARRIHQHDAAVDLALPARREDMQRRPQAERLSCRRGVMGKAVGDDDRAGHALGGHVGEAGGQRLEQAGAVARALRIADLDDARLDIADAAQLALDLGLGGLGLGRAVAQAVRGRAVDDDRDDVLDRLAILEDERRVGQRQRQHDEGERAQDRALAGEHDRRARRQRRQNGQAGQQRQRDERREGEAPHQITVLSLRPRSR